jgi:glycine/D-amino acid oxidase-like deaminating enzyme/nitrite reductase/ring-hydroxylating ferredoxin subunit
MDTRSPWRDGESRRYESVIHDEHFDVLVVGGGITGLTAAYLLKRSGKRVAVCERDRLGAGDTGATTAHLTYATDLPLKDLEQTFGREGAKLAWQGGEIAIALIESIVERERGDCEFKRVPGYYHAPLDQEDDKRTELRETARLAEELGFSAKFLSSAPGVNRAAVEFAEQARFHPLHYLAGLASAIDGDGSRVFEAAAVEQVESDPLRVQVGSSWLSGDYLVVATHVPLMGLAGLITSTVLQTKIYPYTSYAVAAEVPTGSLPEGLFWDTANPYQYLRVDRQAGRELVILGGEDHKTGQESDTEERFDQLEAALRKRIPNAVAFSRWSGQVIETNDGLPYIGETAERQFSATGFSGNGMTFGTLAGLMACDAALGRENPWKGLFAPERMQVRGGLWDYVKENSDYPWQLLKGWVGKHARKSPDDLHPGEGEVLLVDGARVACACDAEGHRHEVSAVCPHLGCLVDWNSAEATWDCPCHGSRFHADGTLLAGPAESGLAPVGPPTATAK